MKLIIVFFFVFSCEELSAQKNADTFPASFVGNWKGSSQFYVDRGLKRTDSAGLIIQPAAGKPGEYIWQFMVYEEAHPNDRIFILKPAGDEKYHWLLDEKDGIVFDCYVFGNSLQCMFELKGEIRYMNLKILNGKLYTDFTTADADVQNRTGKGTDKVPFADTHKIDKFEMGIYEKQP